MKIAVSSQGKTLDSLVDPHFGRAAGFLIVDLDNGNIEHLDNSQAAGMSHGAGIAAAERIRAAGAEVLLTGQVGPKAAQALEAAGISVNDGYADVPVREALSATPQDAS